MLTRDKRTTARLLAVALAAAFALLGAGVHTASAGLAATTKTTNTCWQDVVNDWIQHKGQIKYTYAIPCYTQALQHLNGYADIQGYSNIIDDIHRALLAAIHQDRGAGPPTAPPSGSSGNGNGTGTGTGAGNGTTSHDRSWVQSLADSLGPSNARSIPLPLLVLGGLALILLLAAVATWLAKRIQNRRVTPAPAPAPLPREP